MPFSLEFTAYKLSGPGRPTHFTKELKAKTIAEAKEEIPKTLKNAKKSFRVNNIVLKGEGVK
jgi:hypothetical protein